MFTNFTDLFRRGHVEIALAGKNLEEEIREKRDQYPHAVDEYRFYFDQTWKQVENASPFYRERILDTSSFLEDALVEKFDNLIENESSQREQLQGRKARTLLSYLIEALRERHRLAVTAKLFEGAFRKADAPIELRKLFHLSISEQYVMSYMLEYQGTIATGLMGSLDYFRYLSPTFPLHHVSLWRDSFLRLGCLRLIRSFDARTILYIRESGPFQVFVDTFRHFLSDATNLWLSQRTQTLGQSLPDSRLLTNYLESRIRGLLKPSWNSPTSASEFLQTLEIATKQLQKTKLREIRSPKLYFPATWRMREMDNRNVFVVYGRNASLRKAVFDLLRAAGLHPKEFSEIVHDSGSGAPFVGEAIDLALSKARAIVVILTGDDLAHLKPDLLNEGEVPEEPTPQPRPNVIFEAGLAMAKAPTRTVLVQIGPIREISDLAGRHIVRLRNNVESRKDLLIRLQRAGCDVRLDGNDWMSAGMLPS